MDIVTQLRALTDQELVDAVRRATDDRPALAALHAAAGGQSPGDQVPPVPSTPNIPVTPDVAPPVGIPSGPTSGYTTRGVPTFDSVREKVGQRFGTAIGAEELDNQTPAGQSVQEQWDARAKAGHDRLEAIRKSMQRKGDSD